MKWYMEYTNWRELTAEDREYLDAFTDEGFNNLLLNNFYNEIINTPKLTLKQGVVLARRLNGNTNTSRD